jgi:predicted dienelactone hydrolase
MRLGRVVLWLAALPLIGLVAGVVFIAVLAWRQPDRVMLPMPTGPYAVGRIAADWRDDARDDPFAPAKGTKRELPVWIWYPAPHDARQPRAAYMPPRLREAMEPNPPLLLRLTLGPLYTDRANVTSHALDVPPLVGGTERFPVIILKPALGAAALQNAVLAEDLASHGYVVVGSDSPYTTPGVAYQDGRVAMRTAAGHPSETAPGPISELAPGQPNDFYLPVVDGMVKDNRFVLDRLEMLDERDPSGRFTGRLDLKAVGAFGHSIGGAAALQSCHEDARCRAGIDLDGMPYGDVVRDGIIKPFLFVFADRPIFERPEADLDAPARAFLTAVARMRQRSPGRPSLLLVRGAGHFNFFDQAMLAEPTVFRLFGAAALGPIDPDHGLDLARRYVRAFFDAYLKGTRDPLLDGPNPDFPEVRFR